MLQKVERTLSKVRLTLNFAHGKKIGHKNVRDQTLSAGTPYPFGLVFTLGIEPVMRVPVC